MTYTPPGVEPSRPTAQVPAPKTSGHAIAGLLVGLGGLCTCGVGGIVGLILSIVALKKIGASRGTLGGRGLAIAGIIASAICILVGLIIGLIVLGSFFIAPGRSEAIHAWTESAWDALHSRGEERSPSRVVGKCLGRRPQLVHPGAFARRVPATLHPRERG
jgi:hypothetical protein